MLTLCQELCGKSYIIYPTWLLSSYYVAGTSPVTEDRPCSLSRADKKQMNVQHVRQR